MKLKRGEKLMKKKYFKVLFAIIILGGIICLIIFDKRYNRTNEEYVAILINNKEDFDYVAKEMKKWQKGHIYFDVSWENNDQEIAIGEYLSSNNQEIVYEVVNNDEFYEHLMNLYSLDEISYITVLGDYVAFNFSKNPIKYHGKLCYREKIIIDEGITQEIDNHWVLMMLPDI